MGYFLNKSDAATNQNLKEAYFTASQGRLIRARYKSNRTAMFAGWVLTLMILLGFFSEFLSPYEPTMAEGTRSMRMAPHRFQSFGMKTEFPSDPSFTGPSGNAR